MSKGKKNYRAELLGLIMKHKIKGIFGRNKNDMAMDLIGKREVFHCRPAIFFEDQLYRIKSCPFGKKIHSEVEKIQATRFISSPLERYKIKNCYIAGHHLISESDAHYLGKISAIRSINNNVQAFDRATLTNTRQGLRYFGHWLRDDCTMFGLAHEHGTPISMVRPSWVDSKFYESAFEQSWHEVDFAYCGELTIHRELGFNPEKRTRMMFLRKKIREQVKKEEAGDIVYLRRGRSGELRNPENEEELTQRLENAGVCIVDAETGGKAVQKKILDAKLLISVEGSQVSHCAFGIADKGSLIIIQPPNRFYNPHLEWCRLMGNNYGIVIGELSENGFQVDASDVLRMIDVLH